MDASAPLGWRTGLWPPSASCSLSVGSRLLFFAFPLPLLSRIILLLICHQTDNKMRDERRRDGLASARLENTTVMRRKDFFHLRLGNGAPDRKIGRASCRERVCQYV